MSIIVDYDLSLSLLLHQSRLLLCRFPCNRWLGTGVDDGSTERLLLAARMRGERASRAPAPPPAPPPATPTTTHLSTSTIQHMIGTSPSLDLMASTLWVPPLKCRLPYILREDNPIDQLFPIHFRKTPQKRNYVEV